MGMDHGAVIASTEHQTDFWQGGFGHFTAYIHGDLSRNRNIPGTALGKKIFHTDMELFCDDLLDQFDGDDFCFFIGKNGFQGFDA